MPRLFLTCTGKQPPIQKKIEAPNSGMVFIKNNPEKQQTTQHNSLCLSQNSQVLKNSNSSFPTPLQQKKKKKNYMLMQRHCRNNSQESFSVVFHLQNENGPTEILTVLLRIVSHWDGSSSIQMNSTERITCLIIYRRAKLSKITSRINPISKALDMIDYFSLP